MECTIKNKIFDGKHLLIEFKDNKGNNKSIGDDISNLVKTPMKNIEKGLIGLFKILI